MTTILEADQEKTPLSAARSTRSRLGKLLGCRREKINFYTGLEEVGLLPNYNRGISARGVIIPRNHYMINSLVSMKGSDKRNIATPLSYSRVGGTNDDAVRGLVPFDHRPDDVSFNPTHKEEDVIMERLGWKNVRLTPLTMSVTRLSYRMNLDANPGPSYKCLGYDTKAEAYELMYDVAQAKIDKLRGGEEPGRILFGIAGRSKLKETKKFQSSLDVGKSCGRGIWMADGDESILAHRFIQPIFEHCRDVRKVIMLGFEKFGSDPAEMSSQIAYSDVQLSNDFGDFDASVRETAISRSFDRFRVLFGLTRDGKDENSLIMNYLEENFIRSHLVLPNGDVLRKKSSVPSGSGFTALVDSVVNAECMIINYERLVNKGIIKEYKLFVQGDDNTAGIWLIKRSKDRDERRQVGKQIAEELSRMVKETHGLKLHPDKCVVSTRVYVGYAIPRVPGDIHNFSSNEIKKFRNEESKRLGRSLTLAEKFRFLDEEPVEGGAYEWGTHRWTYLFVDRCKFLSYYFHTNGSMVRPTGEVIARLVNPETKVGTIERHKQLLINAIVDNYGNRHVANRIMHYYYDSIWMEKLGINSPKRAKDDYTVNYFLSKKEDSESGLPLRNLKDERSWYRNQKEVCDLYTDSRMLEFFEEWTKVLKKCEILYHKSIEVGPEYYAWRGKQRRAGRGVTQHSMFLDPTQSGSMFKRHQSRKLQGYLESRIDNILFRRPKRHKDDKTEQIYLVTNGKLVK